MHVVTASVNGVSVFVNFRSSVIEACSHAGVDVPRFCYHPYLSVAGNCRLCLVEIEKAPKPLAACALPVANNMVIRTETPQVQKARESIIESLLLNHPLDCPICDQGGECDLQEQSRTFGSDISRLLGYKRGVEDKNCGPVIKTVMTRCIHCTRCVRYSKEVSGFDFFGTLSRGSSMEIGYYTDGFFDSELSGNVVDLCPVGALTSRAYSFRIRPWDLSTFEGIDFLDILVSSLFYEVYKKSVYRVTPRYNGNKNLEWINDRIRYTFDSVSQFRIRQPNLHRDSFVFGNHFLTNDFDFSVRFVSSDNLSVFSSLFLFNSVDKSETFLRSTRRVARQSLLSKSQKIVKEPKLLGFFLFDSFLYDLGAFCKGYLLKLFLKKSYGTSAFSGVVDAKQRERNPVFLHPNVRYGSSKKSKKRQVALSCSRESATLLCLRLYFSVVYWVKNLSLFYGITPLKWGFSFWSGLGLTRNLRFLLVLLVKMLELSFLRYFFFIQKSWVHALAADRDSLEVDSFTFMRSFTSRVQAYNTLCIVDDNYSDASSFFCCLARSQRAFGLDPSRV